MKTTHNNKGFTLAMSLIFLLLICAFVGALIMTNSNGLLAATKIADLKKSSYVADAGLAEAYTQLRGYTGAPNAFTVNNANYDLGSGKKGSYTVAVTPNSGAWGRYTLTAVGTFNGLSKTLKLDVQAKSISYFAYLSNTEVHPVWGNLWWVNGMTTVGPVNTNGTLNIYGEKNVYSPVFDGEVNQVGSAINYWHGGPPNDNPVFTHGINLSAPPVPFLPVNTLASISTAANAAGLVLTGDSTVVYNSDGTVNITNVARGWNNYKTSLPSNGVIYVQTGTATVQGIVNGQSTLASDRQIYISGNLLYNTDPRIDPDSKDMLAIVSQNDVTVLAAAAPTNIELDAVMVALNGSFQVDQWWVPGKGNMIQFGSLVNNYCGPTGVFDPATGTLYGGYMQLQYYDVRLQTMVPPGFPPIVDSTGRSVYNKLGFQSS